MKTFGTGKQVLLIVGLAVVASLVTAAFPSMRPAWYRVSSAEELRWQVVAGGIPQVAAQGDILWVDARERSKYEEEHLPGAILLNLAEWSDLMFAHLDTLQGAFDRPVVVYCDTTSCGKSLEVAKRLRELVGLDPVYVLKGDWRELRDVTAP